MKGRHALAVASLAATCAMAQDARVKGADVELVRSVRVVADRIAGIVHADRAPSLVAVRADDAARSAETAARAQRLLPPTTAEARGRAWSELGLGSGSEPKDLTALLARDLSGMTLDAARTRLLVDPERMTPDVGHADPDVNADASVLLTTGVTPDEPVAGHYVAHVLLDGPDPSAPPTTDALLARSALAEGTANLAALVFLFGGLGLESEVVAGALRPEDPLEGRLVSDTMRSGSPVLRSLAEFVYLDGFAQAASIARKGGFVRLAQERPARRTTRDVLHVDRAPAPSAEFAAPVFPPSAGLTLVDRDALGEQGVITLVSTLTGKDNLGLIAGDGWAGDALWRFEGDSESATIWLTRWAAEEDAKDWIYALERCLTARFPTESLADDPVRGGRVLRRPDRVYRIQKNGLEVQFTVTTLKTDSKLGPDEKKKVPPSPRKPSAKLK